MVIFRADPERRRLVMSPDSPSRGLLRWPWETPSAVLTALLPAAPTGDGRGTGRGMAPPPGRRVSAGRRHLSTRRPVSAGGHRERPHAAAPGSGGRDLGDDTRQRALR